MKTSLARSQSQEKRVAKTFNGSVNSGSGNGDYRKNDVRTDSHSIELKYTSKNSYSLKLADLLKAEKYALLDGRDVIFGLQMGDRNWVVLSEESYLELAKQW